ncbi:aromatase/cyclase [Nocardia jinanensis]|uniref:Actinorhodin polyketide synthase bifunctional cyclase/dehydratase n=1 Tax=Nocardia jinanensis TaxID=382504 RepID=A0A917VYR4_9NOCA|nr:aromatase/cyclase [Nocardia jinanensis]GGL46414.1 actinorhodin polyketide synthase bifunctional cyclase/dehydratase [Nocardia jinanensis]
MTTETELGPPGRTTRHTVVVPASADRVFTWLSDAAVWPTIFPPTVHIEQLSSNGDDERLAIWATANGEVKSWTSRRRLDRGQRTIVFLQEKSAHPVASMGGMWAVEELSGNRSLVRLDHQYRAVDDDPAATQWIADAVETNSTSELEALAGHAAHGPRETMTILDDVEIDSADAQNVFDFLNDAQHWADRLPHVSAVDFRTVGDTGAQILRMDTAARDESTHTTESVRVSFPGERIVYKQTTPPALMRSHIGCWSFTRTEAACRIWSRHNVVIATDNIGAVLGARATVDDARNLIRDSLSANSRSTLTHAKEYAERLRR